MLVIGEVAPLNKTLSDKDVKGTICTTGCRYFGNGTIQSMIDAGMEEEWLFGVWK